MKTLRNTLGLFARLGIATALLFGQQAMADGADTNYGETVRNTALVDYSVGGTAQPTETSGEVTFDVDRLVVFTVAENQIARTSTTLGASGVGAGSLNYVEYVVTNLTNGPLDFNLSVLSPQSSADDFDMLATRIEIDDGNGDADFTGGDYIDNLAENASILVRIYADTPATGPGDTEVSDLSLVVNGAEPAGTVASPGATLLDGGVWDPVVVQNVFGDTDENNEETAEWGFVLGAPNVSVSKVPTVVSDPFGSADPKAVPGSVMRYTISIVNSGTDTAGGISISDPIDAFVNMYEQVASSGISVVTITRTVPAAAATTCDAHLDGTDVAADGCIYDPLAGPGGTLTVGGASAFDVADGETWTVAFEVVIP